MSGATTCPGCGLELPASGLTPDPRRNASPECWRLYGEVQGFELNHIELARDYHQLAVDAYSAQHAARERSGDIPPIGSPTRWSDCTWRWTAACRARRSAPRTSGWGDPTRPGRACPYPSARAR